MFSLEKFSLAARTFFAIGAGVVVGLFFGEPAGRLQIIGTVFVKLLQLTVLPYVLFSLIVAVGRLSIDDARSLLKIGGGLLLASWALALLVVAAAPMAFPTWESASFFSTALLEDPEGLDLLALYLPGNPFHALANNIVPAVVLFSVAVGAALIGVQGKEPLLEILDVVIQALSRVTRFVARFTPIAVFAIMSSAAGTMGTEEVSRLHVYFVLYVGSSLVLTFWVLPMLLASITPVPYRALFSVTGNALMTGFTTGSLIIILPLMMEGCKKILRDHGIGGEESDRAVDVLIPITLNAPMAGKLLTLIFLPFAAWFVGTPLDTGQYPTFLISGLVTYLGSVNSAMPFLMDLFRIPADMFELFVVTGVISARFSTLLSALNMMVVGLLGACIMTGAIRLSRGRVVLYCVSSALVIGLVIGGSRELFQLTFTSQYDKDRIVSEMTILGQRVPSQVGIVPAESARPDGQNSMGVDAVRKRGILRIGYVPDNLPFSYENRMGELVGLDVELAHRLAAELNVGIAFVPVHPEKIGSALDSRSVDVVLGIPLSVLGSTQFALSQPYLETSLALIVEDHARGAVKTMQDLAKLEGFRIAVIRDHFFRSRVERILPNVEVVELNSVREFFEGQSDDSDALLFTAEAGAAWTLLYPKFSVVVPGPGRTAMPLAIAVQRDNQELRVFVDRWIELATGLGVVRRAYDHWFLGVGAATEEPRWSIVRDVLGWTK